MSRQAQDRYFAAINSKLLETPDLLERRKLAVPITIISISTDAVRGLPALAAEIHNMRADHQILHHEARVAFEAGAARWCGDFDGPFLVDRKLRPRTAPSATLIAGTPR